MIRKYGYWVVPVGLLFVAVIVINLSARENDDCFVPLNCSEKERLVGSLACFNDCVNWTFRYPGTYNANGTGNCVPYGTTEFHEADCRTQATDRCKMLYDRDALYCQDFTSSTTAAWGTASNHCVFNYTNYACNKISLIPGTNVYGTMRCRITGE